MWVMFLYSDWFKWRKASFYFEDIARKNLFRILRYNKNSKHVTGESDPPTWQSSPLNACHSEYYTFRNGLQHWARTEMLCALLYVHITRGSIVLVFQRICTTRSEQKRGVLTFGNTLLLRNGKSNSFCKMYIGISQNLTRINANLLYRIPNYNRELDFSVLCFKNILWVSEWINEEINNYFTKNKLTFNVNY